MITWDHWHIEPSSICALQCPRCPRAEVPETLLNSQLTLAFFQDQIGEAVIKKIKKITFCGNDGDPIYCRDFLDICRWIKSVNPLLHLVIVTNGSYKSPDWWKSLSEILDHRDEITWSIDGWDQNSNAQYRVNCDWTSIMTGINAFCENNHVTYRIWAAIAFRFNQDQLDSMTDIARSIEMDLFQLTKSTKFGSHYPETYGIVDPLCPDRKDLVSSGHRFERLLRPLTDRLRPSDALQEIFWQRAQDLDRQQQYAGICLIGNKGVFLNSRGEFYPCCWTANRYAHNQQWHDLARTRCNLWHRSFSEIISDDFWRNEFLNFDSQECRTKCTPDRLKQREHVTEW